MASAKRKTKREKRIQRQEESLSIQIRDWSNLPSDLVGRICCRCRSSRDWSNLPSDLVGRISSCCRSSGDRVRLATVSTRWRSSAVAAAKIAKISHPPWLLLPRDPTALDPPRSQFVYSLSERKLYPIAPIADLQRQHHPNRNPRGGGRARAVPGAKAMRCIGSGVGWMITVSDSTADLQLHDLVTNSITPLPPLSSFPDVHKALDKRGRITGYTHGPDIDDKCIFDCSFRSLGEAHLFYNRAIFFPHQSLVFLICNSHWRLAFARIGGQNADSSSSWTVCVPDLQSAPSIAERDLSVLSDVAFHKGNFYAATKYGYIMEIHLNSSPFPTYRPLPLEPPPDDRVPVPTYLVEVVEDELMLVQGIQYVDAEDMRYFNVYKCSISRSKEKEGQCQRQCQWIEVKSLDKESVLFLGDSLSPLLLSTKDFPELTPNSIYYVRNQILEVCSRDLKQVQMGVFHLENREIEFIKDFPSFLRATYHIDGDHPNWPPPVWIPHSQCFPLFAPRCAEEESSSPERTRNNWRKRTKKMLINGAKLPLLRARDRMSRKKKLMFPSVWDMGSRMHIVL